MMYGKMKPGMAGKKMTPKKSMKKEDKPMPKMKDKKKK